MIAGGEHNTITSIIHYNWVVKVFYLHGRSDDNYNQRREKAVMIVGKEFTKLRSQFPYLPSSC